MPANIPVIRTSQSRLTEDLRENSPFGTNYSDHMFVADWCDGQWKDARIVPFGPMELSPATTALHYGQSFFEGFKAHRTADGRIALFRPMANHARLNRTAARLAMPELPESLFREGLLELIRTDSEWVPYREGGSLYVRPVFFGTDDSLMVRPANRYRFVIFTAPGGPYFAQPIRLLAEETYVRAFPGGTGDAKTAGNYGGGLLAAKHAQAKGYHNVLWLDGKERRFLEESGVMNVMVNINGVAITPPLSGTILPGITRDSVLTLLRESGAKVEERPVSIDEVLSAQASGKLHEAFGIGTAAVIAPIACIGCKGKDYEVPTNSPNAIAAKIKSQLTAIQLGRVPDTHNWLLYL
ncbi:MAG TPA: branched-chain amino acid aminotransferase [Candidatus Eisenbacteria bacterium]|nr:branched-chain amino acid aminotransferase [Candidatus Eisenbacteria bacterium]